MNVEDHKSIPFKQNKIEPYKLISLAILMFIVVSATLLLSGRKDKPNTNTVEEKYQIPQTKLHLNTNVKPPFQIAVGPRKEQEPLIIKQDMQAELAKAQAKDFIERLQAKQNTASNNALSASISNQSDPIAGSSVKISDPNTSFLNQASNSKATHVYATHYGSLPYMLSQGKFIFANLAVAINSDLPAQITAVVSQDVYGDQGRKVLIPRGSLLIGEYKSGLVNNQSRIFVVWTRVREPSGIDAALGSEGTDYLGRGGLSGSTDYHFFARFGAASLVALIGGAASTVGVNPSDDYNSMAIYRQNVSQALSQQAGSMLSQSVNIPPTVHIPQGEKIVVFVNRDIDFSSVLQ